jgi:hypothetical protein
MAGDAVDNGPGEGEKPGAAPPRYGYCSFCRKSYKEVGPLVEGPDQVSICTECIDLCQDVVDQEKARRSQPDETFAYICAKLDRIIRWAQELKTRIEHKLLPGQIPSRPPDQGKPTE